MSLSMYDASVPVLTRMLTNLSAILDKAAASAEARKIDPSVLISARLAPDMFALARQVQVASDGAKGGVARLAGVEIPSYEDTESTFPELKARIAKTVAFLNGLDKKKFEGAETRSITMKMRDAEVTFPGQVFLLNFVLPNFYFHVTTAYAILRQNGVDIGKRDFLGAA